MSILDKTRKLLWGNSGDRCALCGRKLTHPATASDEPVVVGDECHIVSKSPNGPRYDPAFPGDHDGYDNLLLLCTSDNRRVDTQVGTFTVEKLKQVKTNHEAEVARVMDAHFRQREGLADGRPPKGFDNYRTEIVFATDQPESQLERLQQMLIHDPRMRAYGKVGTGFHGTAAARDYAWIQAFLPVSEQLLRDLAVEAGVIVSEIRHMHLPRVYDGLIPS